MATMGVPNIGQAPVVLAPAAILTPTQTSEIRAPLTPTQALSFLSASPSGPGVALLPCTRLAHSSDPSGHASYGLTKYVGEGDIAESSKVVT